MSDVSYFFRDVTSKSPVCSQPIAKVVCRIHSTSFPCSLSFPSFSYILHLVFSSPFTTLAERFPKWIGITQQVSFPIHPGRYRFSYHHHHPSSSRTPTSNTCCSPSSRSIPDPQSFAPLQLDRVWLNGYNVPHPVALVSQTPSIPWTVKLEGDKKIDGEKLGEKLSMSGKLILTSFYWEARFIRYRHCWNVVAGCQLTGTAYPFQTQDIR